VRPLLAAPPKAGSEVALKRSRWIVAAAVVVVAVVAWMVLRPRDKAPTYRTTEVTRGALEARVSATGTVRPVVQVDVGSQVSGTIGAIFVDYNDTVKKGEVLCQIEPSSFRARAVQAGASVTSAEAALKEAERALKRANELVQQNYISTAEQEAAQVAVEQRRADLEQARAQLQAAQVDLANTTIRSPIDGVVIARSINLGQTVAASLQAPVLFMIANDLKRMQVETRIDEADIGRIAQGQRVDFTVDAFPDRAFQGEVSQVRLEPIAEQGVVTYTTVIATRNDEMLLRPGMTANVAVLTDSRDDVLKVSNAALRFSMPGARSQGMGRQAAAGGAQANGGAQAHGGGGHGDGARPSGDAQVAPSREGGAAKPASGPGGRAPKSAGADGEKKREMPEGFKPGTVYVLRGGKPELIHVLSGISDGASTEIRSHDLQPGDQVVIGTESTGRPQQSLQAPPGLGGPTFRGPTRRPRGGS
jgi:HlyD family secretion protein